MRNRIAPLLAATALFAAGCTPGTGGVDSASSLQAITLPSGERLTGEQARWRAHVATLADDAMQGREAGSPGYERAAAYVVEQLTAIGVRPGGTGGSWFQPVPLVDAALADQGSAAVVTGGTPAPLRFGMDFVPSPTPGQASVALDAPAIFVGQGVAAEGHDDFAGLDVKGKIVLLASGAPEGLQGEVRAHAARLDNKAVEAARRGAVAVITVVPPNVSLAQFAEGYREPRMTWRTPQGTGFLPAGIPQWGVMSAAAAQALVGNLTRGATSGTKRLRIASRTGFTPVESKNVVGVIPGTDPTLANEYVVLTAHLDHLGVRADGEVYNGAMDNASGVASMIEAARILRATPGRRPIMLIALTAEEKGLVGADYFARHPVVPISNIVANVNLDMPILTYDFTDMFAFGADRSTLGPITRDALSAIGLTLTPDPDPREALFTRSDHYRFVQAGVPVLFLKTGFAGEGAAATKTFRSGPYHDVNDDMSLPFHWAAAIRFVEANAAIARGIANAEQRPRWNRGDYFGTLYNGYGAK